MLVKWRYMMKIKWAIPNSTLASRISSSKPPFLQDIFHYHVWLPEGMPSNLAIYGKTKKSRGVRTALRNHSCWCIVGDVGTCWQMLADVGMYDFESSLAKNELGRWLPHDDLVVFKKKSSFTNEQCSKPLLVDVVSFFLVGVGRYILEMIWDDHHPWPGNPVLNQPTWNGTRLGNFGSWVSRWSNQG